MSFEIIIHKSYRPNPYIYFPFGIGHRSCIGKIFAMVRYFGSELSSLNCCLFQMEAKVLMVHLLRTFHVTLAQDYKLEIKQATTIHPKGGVPCTLIAKE